MQALSIPAVTQQRVSGDYQPGNSQWEIGDSSILAHAVGLAPFKDVSMECCFCACKAGVHVSCVDFPYYV